MYKCARINPKGVRAMYEKNNVHSPDCKKTADGFEEVIISEADRVKPMIREQLLRSYILNIGDTNEIFDIYCRAFNTDPSQNVRMVILRPSGTADCEDFFFINNTAQQYIGEEHLLLGTIIKNFILIITTMSDTEEISEVAAVKRCYGHDMVAVYSKSVCLADAAAAYERLRACMGYLFYSNGNRTLYEEDINIDSGDIAQRNDYSLIENAIKGGDSAAAERLILAFFNRLRSAMPAPAVCKTYCMELYVSIIRCCRENDIERYMKGIVHVQDARTLSDIESLIEITAAEIAKRNEPETLKIYSSLIRDTIRIIDENIENENLSLRWLAGTILYTNVDYLGKLFKKETGKNFSHYIMEKRMEMAKDIIFEGKMDRIYEVAESVGYGSNSQYFSQVFKKYTGVSPLEYKEFARLTHEKKAAVNNT